MEFQVSLQRRKQMDSCENRGKRELWFANDDIPMDILSRLSTKTLLELKRVSKQWNCLISDRTFVSRQLRKTETISGFFFQQKFKWCDDDIDGISYIAIGSEGGVKINDTVLNFFPESVVILASCNGLICCRSCFPSLDPVIYICNPVKKEWTSLQWPNPDTETSLAFAFDPFKNPIDVSTVFKVVTVCQIELPTGDCQFLFDIYSSETREWSRSREICHSNHELIKNKGVFVGGIFYWPTNGDEILMFDLENELSWLITVPLPATELSMMPRSCIGEFENSLHYILLSDFGLQLWILEDHFASQWALKYSISLNELEQENSEFIRNLAETLLNDVISDFPGMDTLAFKDGILLMRVSVNVYSFEFETRKMKKLCSLSDLGPNSILSPIVVPYTMSLVPLS